MNILSGGESTFYRADNNKIAVVASGISFKFYVNNQNIDNVSDNNAAYLQGHTGLAADTFGTPTQVIYKAAKLWQLA